MNKIVNGVANDYEFNDIGYYQEINIPARQIGKTYQVTNMYEQKYNQLQSNWNSLREYIGEEWYCFDNESVEHEVAKNILDKMNELEGENNGHKSKDV